MPHSSDTSDRAWDAFVARSPLGQFQQTSGWARVKALEGWRLQRILANPQTVNDGGLQILWKPTRLGRIGYVSKGPILPDETPELVDATLERASGACSRIGLRALVLQPPDDSAITPAHLIAHGFSRSVLESVIRATAVIDLAGGREAFLSRMGRQTRREARQASNRGVTVRLGNSEDLRVFFQLMTESCRRQSSQPNPSRPELLEALWDALSPRVSLGLAYCHGQPVSGLLMVGHGNRLTFWKKGWNSHESKSYANTLLNVEALGWAFDRGFRFVDFAAIDVGIAEILLAAGKLTDQQRSTRHMFNLRLGATPRLLPPARLLILNRAIRRVFSFCCQIGPLNKLLMQHRTLGG